MYTGFFLLDFFNVYVSGLCAYFEIDYREITG